MIKLKNTADFLEGLFQSGAFAAATNLSPVSIPVQSYLIGLRAFVGVAGTGTVPTFDILQNGATIFGATKETFVAGQREASYAATPLTNPISVAPGDIFTLSTIGTWGTTQSTNLVVMLLFRNAKQSPYPSLLQGDFYLQGDGE